MGCCTSSQAASGDDIPPFVDTFIKNFQEQRIRILPELIAKADKQTSRVKFKYPFQSSESVRTARISYDQAGAKFNVKKSQRPLKIQILSIKEDKKLFHLYFKRQGKESWHFTVSEQGVFLSMSEFRLLLINQFKRQKDRGATKQVWSQVIKQFPRLMNQQQTILKSYWLLVYQAFTRNQTKLNQGEFIYSRIQDRLQTLETFKNQFKLQRGLADQQVSVKEGLRQITVKGRGEGSATKSGLLIAKETCVVQMQGQNFVRLNFNLIQIQRAGPSQLQAQLQGLKTQAVKLAKQWKVPLNK